MDFRYYAIEIWNNDGQKEWVFMEEGQTGEDNRKGEANPYWEPPCVAEEEFPDEKPKETDLVFDGFLPVTAADADADFKPIVPPLQEIEVDSEA